MPMKMTGVCHHGKSRPRRGILPRRDAWLCAAVSIWLTGAAAVAAQVQSVAEVDLSEPRPAKFASAVPL